MLGVEGHIGAQLAQQLSAVFGNVLAQIVGARGGETGIDLAPPGAGAPGTFRNALLLQVDTRLDRGGIALARSRRIETRKAQAAVVREEHRHAGRFALAALHLQVGAAPCLQRQVHTLELVVVAFVLLIDVGTAHGHMLTNPLLAAATHGHVLAQITGRVFVVHQQALLVAGQRRITGDGVCTFTGNLGQRTARDDAPLIGVHLIVRTAHQLLGADGAPRGTVTHFQHDDVRAGQDVGMAQVVEATARAQQLGMTVSGIAVGGKHAQLRLGLSQFGGLVAAQIRGSTVQRTLVLRKLGPRQARGVVAPQRLVLVPVGTHIHAALRIHITCSGGVVTISQVVLIGIQTAEHVLRIGIGKAIEEAADGTLGGVRLSGDQVFRLKLGLQVEGQTRIGEQVFVSALLHKPLVRAADTIALQGHIGQRHTKEILARHIHAQLALDLASAAVHGHIEFVLTHGHHVLGNKLAFQIHGVALTVDVQRRALGNIAALYTNP